MNTLRFERLLARMISRNDIDSVRAIMEDALTNGKYTSFAMEIALFIHLVEPSDAECAAVEVADLIITNVPENHIEGVLSDTMTFVTNNTPEPYREYAMSAVSMATLFIS